MADALQNLVEKLQARFSDALRECKLDRQEVTIEVFPAKAIEVFTALRDESDFAFEQVMDICGVDYSTYGEVEWATSESTNKGFSRGVIERATSRSPVAIQHTVDRVIANKCRFAAVYQLLSVSLNQRVRVRIFASDNDLPVVPSVVGIWAASAWYEREAFDLYGIVFEGHPDLRRILTDYGFIGHPFRKDFPLIGHVEMRYDPERGRVVYEPVSIEPRVLVPRVIRKDHHYLSGSH
ncbi:NADH-quinone oxidoreductase subunit C [Candidatus Contendibacter odensensis]|uniref:NADH-quinone oxidoreductase subunit C n=1 Tax=Candidatus Contendobacter odensis Run_B_J11 TaxID=1400861 RepID=A0A7U7J2N3_9GAMM|nr:NADH-quinone oxidoreductase subunit C [Candidatus Contendobacter odensis]CDH43503.1 NADH-quinone oxidoreductase subunit C [Candidatus Contendobacter odensis Run_B_J11]